MKTQEITIPLYPCGTATITLPELLTSEAFARLDSAISDALREPRRESGTDAPGDPGAIEFASWRLAQY